ncbi:MAG: sialidase family protein, partial [Saprospiraceae bacterium]
FDPNGRLYLTSLTLDEAFGPILSVLSWSDDGGAHWQSKLVATNTDKPWMAIDRSPQSPFFGRKYIPLATESDMDCLVFDSNDSLLFTSKPFLQPYEFIQLASVDVQSDGDVFVGHYYELGNEQGLKVLKSEDGAASFVSEVQVAETAKTIFNSIPGVSTNMNPTPYLAVDRSGGPFHDRIYMAYTDIEIGASNVFDIYIAWSDDDAQTWTVPKTVHPNTAPGTQQFYSSIFVNENGTVIIGYYDHRDDPLAEITDFYLAISVDGGEHFTETKMNSMPFDFTPAQSANFGFGIGDYGQILATAQTAIAFWSDGRTNDGDLNVYFSKLPINNQMVGTQEISTISDKIGIGKPFPVPATTQVSIPYKLKEPAQFAYKFYSEDGKLQRSGQTGLLAMGNNLLQLEVPATPGALLLCLETKNGFLKTLKIR